jgi:hypothetical protein
MKKPVPTVQVSVRLGTSTSVSRPGWSMDTVAIQSCQTQSITNVYLPLV